MCVRAQLLFLLPLLFPLLCLASGQDASSEAADFTSGGDTPLQQAQQQLDTLPDAASTNSTAASSSPTDVSSSDAQLVLLFITVSILIGAAMRFLLRHWSIPLPYTVVMLVVGLLFGLQELGSTDPATAQPLSASMLALAHMQPRLVLFVFLPPLIFDSAYNAHLPTFVHVLSGTLLLSTVGVLIGAVLTGVFVRLVFPYQFSWELSFTLGGLLSATDPVAVVAMLRELGVPHHLATIIEAESLLNDGTAYITYLLFLELATGATTSAAATVGRFAQISLGGPAFGTAFGLVTVTCLNRVFNDLEVEIIVPIVASYLCFILAEDHLNVSGILSLVMFGLTVGKYRHCISPSVQIPLGAVLAFLAFLANTLLFTLTGVIVSERLILGGNISGSDVGYMFLLYLALQVIRGILAVVLWPFMRATGVYLNWADMLALVFSGLRGALSLVLALVTQLDSTALDKRAVDLIVFHTAGIVLLSLVINGSTARFLVQGLRLHQGSVAARSVLAQAFRHVQERVKQRIDIMYSEGKFLLADWSTIRRGVAERKETMAKQVLAIKQSGSDEAGFLTPASPRARYLSAADTEAAKEALPAAGEKLPADVEAANPSTPPTLLEPPGHPLLRQAPSAAAELEIPLASSPALASTLREELLHRYLNSLRSDYGRQYASMMITRPALHILNAAVDRSQDVLQEQPLEKHWQFVAKHLRQPAWLTFLYRHALSLWVWWPCRPFRTLADWFQHRVFLHACLSVELSISVVSAKNRMEVLLTEFPELERVHPAAVNELKELIHQYQQRALVTWADLQGAYPTAYSAIQSRHVTQLLLLLERETLRALYSTALLESNEHERMKDVVESAIYWLERTEPETQASAEMQSPYEMLDGMAGIQHLAPERKREIHRGARLLIIQPGDTVDATAHGAGAEDGCLLIVRGAATCELSTGSALVAAKAAADSAMAASSSAAAVRTLPHAGSFPPVDNIELAPLDSSIADPNTEAEITGLRSPAAPSPVRLGPVASELSRRIRPGALVLGPAFHTSQAVSVVEAFDLSPALLRYLHADAITGEWLWRAQAQVVLDTIAIDAEHTSNGPDTPSSRVNGVDAGSEPSWKLASSSVPPLVARAAFHSAQLEAISPVDSDQLTAGANGTPETASRVEATSVHFHADERILLLAGELRVQRWRAESRQSLPLESVAEHKEAEPDTAPESSSPLQVLHAWAAALPSALALKPPTRLSEGVVDTISRRRLRIGSLALFQCNVASCTCDISEDAVWLCWRAADEEAVADEAFSSGGEDTLAAQEAQLLHLLELRDQWTTRVPLRAVSKVGQAKPTQRLSVSVPPSRADSQVSRPIAPPQAPRTATANSVTFIDDRVDAKSVGASPRPAGEEAVARGSPSLRRALATSSPHLRRPLATKEIHGPMSNDSPRVELTAFDADATTGGAELYYRTLPSLPHLTTPGRTMTPIRGAALLDMYSRPSHDRLPVHARTVGAGDRSFAHLRVRPSISTTSRHSVEEPAAPRSAAPTLLPSRGSPASTGNAPGELAWPAQAPPMPLRALTRSDGTIERAASPVVHAPRTSPVAHADFSTLSIDLSRAVPEAHGTSSSTELSAERKAEVGVAGDDDDGDGDITPPVFHRTEFDD